MVTYSVNYRFLQSVRISKAGKIHCVPFNVSEESLITGLGVMKFKCNLQIITAINSIYH